MCVCVCREREMYKKNNVSKISTSNQSAFSYINLYIRVMIFYTEITQQIDMSENTVVRFA